MMLVVATMAPRGCGDTSSSEGLTSSEASSGAASSGTGFDIKCTPPSCGGQYVGDWSLVSSCAITPVPLAGCGTVEIAFGDVSGSLHFGADKTYEASLSLGKSIGVLVPDTCTKLMKCSALDSPFFTCSGTPPSDCVCEGTTIEEKGTLSAVDGALELTSNEGASVLKVIDGYCVESGRIEVSIGSVVVAQGKALPP
jgi:hypothetical protein